MNLTEEIARYIRERPESADTLEGIQRWWIRRQRMEESLAAVEAAVKQLIDERVLREETLHDGTRIYCSANKGKTNTGAQSHSKAVVRPRCANGI